MTTDPSTFILTILSQAFANTVAAVSADPLPWIPVIILAAVGIVLSALEPRRRRRRQYR